MLREEIERKLGQCSSPWWVLSCMKCSVIIILGIVQEPAQNTIRLKAVEYTVILIPREDIFQQTKEHLFWEQCFLVFFSSGKLDGNFQANVFTVKEIKIDIHISAEGNQKITTIIKQLGVLFKHKQFLNLS